MLEVLNLNENNCADCYKCIRTCSVKAITYANNTAEIVHDECILCGNCFVACPQKAKQVRNDVPRVKEAIAAGKHVVCSLAPSFIADFRIRSLDVMTDALKRLGFAEVQETAVGAQLVSDEYARIMREGKQRVLISSCCPSINMLIQKYYPTMLPHLAKVLTPMQAHCKAIKEQNPEAFTVFIGPCIAKKAEADESPYTDIALTYDELRDWLAAEHIELPTDHVEPGDGKRARFYPATGGVLKATDKVEGYRRIAIDGVDNCRAVFDELENSQFGNVFIEMSACEGSCVNGPCIREHTERRLKGALRVDTFAGDQRFDVAAPDTISYNYPFLGGKKVKFGSEAINDMLYKMGKTSPEKELNCGSCGYDTCREKAIAVLSGKADLNMCLPFLLSKAESFSDTIIKNTPNAILVVNEAMEVQQINAAACKLFNVGDPRNILGDQVVHIMDPMPFIQAYTQEKNIAQKGMYLADYKKYVDMNVIYAKSYHILICTMRDVTEDEKAKVQKAELSRTTIEITDKVIEKQMRAVQEIASLLGETTAETKVALTKLKESLENV